MSPFTLKNKALTIAMFVGLFGPLAGCYDASQAPRGNPGTVGGGGPGKPALKPIGFVMLDVIRMSVDAMKKPGCSLVPSSLIELREAEAQMRIKGMTAVLDSLSDVVRIHQTEISVDDCKTMAAIDERADRARPGESAGLSPAIRAKLALHVRLVIWNGDRASKYPSWTVYSNSWDSRKALIDQGISNTMSVTHFAATSTTYGYIGSWFNRVLRSENVFLATTIEAPSVDDRGFALLSAATAKSTEDFGTWLLQRVERVNSK